MRLCWWLSCKETACQCRRYGFDPWIEKIPWRRKWQSTPVFLPGKSHGQRSLGGLQSMGLQRVTQDLVTPQHLYYSTAGTSTTIPATTSPAPSRRQASICTWPILVCSISLHSHHKLLKLAHVSDEKNQAACPWLKRKGGNGKEHRHLCSRIQPSECLPSICYADHQQSCLKKCRGAGVLKILLSWKTLCAVTAIMT